MITLWIGFFLIILALLALDLGVFHRQPRALRFGDALGWSAFWVAMSLLFNGCVYFIYEYQIFGATMPLRESAGGNEAAVRFFTGYLLEKSLSVDNIFVMALLFRQFRIEPRYQHRVLFWGIIGAIISRSAMILVGVWLVTRFDWLFYVFGAYLAFAGMKILFAGVEEKTFAPEDSFLLRHLSRLLRITRGDHNGRFATRVDGRLAFTRLALALIVIELTDVIFALDSVPAVLAITTDSFIVLTSNIFAILGLRAMYFVLASVMSQFRYLQLALAVVLIVIGTKMFLHNVFSLPTPWSLALIGTIIGVGIGASLISNR